MLTLSLLDGVAWGTTRGRYMLLSAGQDTIFTWIGNEHDSCKSTDVQPE